MACQVSSSVSRRAWNAMVTAAKTRRCLVDATPCQICNKKARHKDPRNFFGVRGAFEWSVDSRVEVTTYSSDLVCYFPPPPFFLNYNYQGPNSNSQVHVGYIWGRSSLLPNLWALPQSTSLSQKPDEAHSQRQKDVQLNAVVFASKTNV